MKAIAVLILDITTGVIVGAFAGLFIDMVLFVFWMVWTHIYAGVYEAWWIYWKLAMDTFGYGGMILGGYMGYRINIRRKRK